MSYRTAPSIAGRSSRKVRALALHPVNLLLTDLEWEALRGHHRDGLSMTDSRYIGLLLGQEVARVAKQDAQLKELRQALLDSRAGHAQG